MNLKSHCPINYGLEHFGDKWSLLIIRDLMFKGKRHYNEFFDSEEKVSTSVLGDRLKNLELDGIISKSEDAVKKSRINYSLTEKGIALLPMMVEMILWSSYFDKNTAAEKEFIKKAKSKREELLNELSKKLKKEHLDK
jgi:DNA-binding HxlR family transcriptional regulator